MDLLKMNKHKSSSTPPNNVNAVERARSSLSVSGVDYYVNIPSNKRPFPAISSVTLTPGRIRNIDQDMENIRASRQDNPFIQQVIASRESLIDSLDSTEDADDANLMAKELALDLDIDPFSIPELHKHMIRSPPPIHWPKSPNFRVFQFPANEETISVEVDSKDQHNKSPGVKSKQLNWDDNELPMRKPSLGKIHNSYQERFALRTPSNGGPSSEDSVHLMSED